MPKFDRKSFNPQAFGKYMETVPKERENTLIKANIFKADENIANAFSDQTGTAYAIIPMVGRLSGKPVNYDGVTSYDDPKNLSTYERGVVVIGRKDKFSEQDFSYDITAKKDFMSQVGDQLGDYWDSAWEDSLIAIIKGLFASTGNGGKVFAEKHTTSISVSELTTTILNKAIQKACGDKKQKFSLTIMNSYQATDLENQKLLTFLTYNDANGLEKQLNLAQWNGKLVLVDDNITYDSETGEYVIYILGERMFDKEDVGAKVPHEMVRDADNDRDLLYERDRKVFAPYGFSYLKANQKTNSPTDEELADGSNWDLATNGEGEYFPHKEIAIAKVVLTETTSTSEEVTA